MAPGICPHCSKDCKNLGSHLKYCKSKPVETKQETPIVEPEKTQEPTSTIESNEEPMPSTDKVEEIADFNKINFIKPTPWYKKIFTRKPKEKKQVNINELFNNLPKWAIKQKKPWGSPKNKNATWIQIVAFSRTRPPKAVWAEYDGVSISIDDMFFPAPHEIRGEIFPYDMDKGVPLLDNSEQYNDMSYWNKLVERVKNMYFTLGLVSGAGDFTKNIGLILLLVGISLLATVANIILTYSLSKDFAAASMQIGNVTTAVQTYINNHP